LLFSKLYFLWQGAKRVEKCSDIVFSLVAHVIYTRNNITLTCVTLKNIFSVKIKKTLWDTLPSGKGRFHWRDFALVNLATQIASGNDEDYYWFRKEVRRMEERGDILEDSVKYLIKWFIYLFVYWGWQVQGIGSCSCASW
jgi:hypothetical protein